MAVDWSDPKFRAILIIAAIFILAIFLGQIATGYSYKITLALILCAVIFIITLVNTDAGLAVLIFSMLLSPEIILGQVPGRDIVIRFDDILLTVITFAWLAKTAVNKGLALFVKTPLNKAVGFYILVCLIATLQGAALGYVVPAKGFFYVLRYIEYFLLFILVVNHIHSRKQIEFFLKAFFITCALVSVYGILQIPTGRRVSAPFEGEAGEPNTFGGYLLLIFCIAMGIFLQKISKRLKIILVGMCVLIIIPFFYTLSRASYLGIIFSLVAFVVLSRRRAVLITVASAILISGLVIRPEAVFSRVKYTFQEKQDYLAKIGGTYLDASASARIFSWQEGFKAWEKNPILGRGITGAGFIDGQYARTLPELGIIGILALLWLLWTIFKNSLSIHKKMKNELYKGLTLGFTAGFIGLAIHALTANTFIIIRIMEPFWFLVGIIMMLPEMEQSEEEAASPEKS
jgi:O-antigen ligase